MHSVSPEQPAFIRHQLAFAGHIRQPEVHPRPADVEERRMAIYNELFYNNIEGFLATSFPVLRQITADHHWHAMARDFFARHRCRTPQFTRLAEEFLAYLQHERESQPDDPPFLWELAHYEWVELALSLSDADQQLPMLDRDGDLLSGHPVVSPLAWRLCYDFAVHRIGPDYLPGLQEARQTHLLVYRDRSDEVGFLEIDPLTHVLLQLLETEPAITGEEAVHAIVMHLKPADPDSASQAGQRLLQDLKRRDILLGTAR